MNLGNSIQLTQPEDLRTTVFKIDSVKAFINCLSTLAHYVRNRQRKHVLLISESKYRFEKVRALYFIFLNDKYSSASHDGRSIQDMHKEFKRKYLLPILCRESQDFADLVLRETEAGITNQMVEKLLSVADGSITTTKILGEYLDTVKQNEVNK